MCCGNWANTWSWKKTFRLLHLPIPCCFRNRKFGVLTHFSPNEKRRISVPSLSFKSLICKDLKATSQSPPQRTKENFEAQNEPRVALVDPKTLEETHSNVRSLYCVYCIKFAVLRPSCSTWDVNHQEFGEVPLDVSTQPDRLPCVVCQEPDIDRINISEESTFLLVDPWGSCTKEPDTVDTVMQCLQVSQFSQLSHYFPTKHLGYYIIPVLHDNCMIITWYFTTSFSPLTSILEKRGKVSGHLSCAKAWHPARTFQNRALFSFAVSFSVLLLPQFLGIFWFFFDS